MRQAGLREPGTLAELLELSDGELQEVFAELAVDAGGAVNACGRKAARWRAPG